LARRVSEAGQCGGSSRNSPTEPDGMCLQSLVASVFASMVLPSAGTKEANPSRGRRSPPATGRRAICGGCTFRRRRVRRALREEIRRTNRSRSLPQTMIPQECWVWITRRRTRRSKPFLEACRGPGRSGPRSRPEPPLRLGFRPDEAAPSVARQARYRAFDPHAGNRQESSTCLPSFSTAKV
jgi:hypothetical protein